MCFVEKPIRFLDKMEVAGERFIGNPALHADVGAAGKDRHPAGFAGQRTTSLLWIGG